MKTVILYSAIAIGIAFNSGCKKDNSGANPADNEEPLVTLVGTTIGSPVTASIDASGGTLSSADGILQLTVPAGAVNTATVFSIQPVSNYCPGGMLNAYRLLPEGVTFAQPVSLNFSYADTQVVNEKFLAIAYQGADKTWFAPIVFSLNAAGNNISIQTKHFSDWTVFQGLSIEPSDAAIKINSNLDLEVVPVGFSREPILGEDGVELFNLNVAGNYTIVWQVNGTNGNATSGRIVQNDDRTTAKYTAPSTPPSQNPVAVSATLTNMSFTLNGETFNNPQVIANIMVFGDKFSVVFTTSRPYWPVGNTSFIETDMGSMSVILLQDDLAMVSEIYNENAVVTPSSLSEGSCTYSVVSPGDGLCNVPAGVSFSGGYSSFNNIVYIGVSSLTYPMGNAPSFRKNCGSSSEIVGGERMVTFPYGFNFDARKDYQEFEEVIPGGGFFSDGFIKTAVTKVK